MKSIIENEKLMDKNEENVINEYLSKGEKL